jgi:hypothetical protein
MPPAGRGRRRRSRGAGRSSLAGLAPPSHPRQHDEEQRRGQRDQEDRPQPHQLAARADRRGDGRSDGHLHRAERTQQRAAVAELAERQHVGDRERRPHGRHEGHRAGGAPPGVRHRQPAEARHREHRADPPRGGERADPVADAATDRLGRDRQGAAGGQQQRRGPGLEPPGGDGEHGQEDDGAVLRRRGRGPDRRGGSDRLAQPPPGTCLRLDPTLRQVAEGHRHRRHHGQHAGGHERGAPPERGPGPAEQGGQRQAGRERHAEEPHDRALPVLTAERADRVDTGGEERTGRQAEQHERSQEGRDAPGHRGQERAGGGQHEGHHDAHLGPAPGEQEPARDVGHRDRTGEQAQGGTGVAEVEAEIVSHGRIERGEDRLTHRDGQVRSGDGAERSPPHLRGFGTGCRGPRAPVRRTRIDGRSVVAAHRATTPAHRTVSSPTRS